MSSLEATRFAEKQDRQECKMTTVSTLEANTSAHRP